LQRLNAPDKVNIGKKAGVRKSADRGIRASIGKYKRCKKKCRCRKKNKIWEKV
jgi:hypothetical protein